jgi:imidazolonepropionase-like amidohydrolase
MIIIKNAVVKTMAGQEFKNGSVVIEGSKIKEVGDLDLRNFNAETIIDAKGMLLTPGLVDPHCHVGIMEVGIQFEGNDTNEMSGPVFPELRGIDSIYMQDTAFSDAYSSGVTTVCTGPGSANAIGGTFTAIKTYGKTVDDVIIKEETSMKMALGENPKRVYGTKQQTPGTRMATAALIREWLFKAKEYHQKLKEAQKTGENKPAFNMKLESLMRVFDGMPVKIHAHRADDIMTAVRIIKEFNLKGTIDHATEAYLIPEKLKDQDIPLIIGPTLGYASKYELRNKSFKSAAVLEENNIEFSIMTDHPIITLDTTLVQSALFIKDGLSKKTALEAHTIKAAKLNGIDDRVGSIEPGKDADLVIWDGCVFDVYTRPEMVMINGKVVHRKK